ncbi:MAG: metal ABC transporter substrate-binding protein [Verrucomicrobiota bacterium]|nr:metal ABC transporter substrate-binding protein [Verrucomicrobiota bacterium]
MKRIIVLFVALLTTAWQAAQSADKLRIVTTTSDLAAIAKAVAGDLADVAGLCDGKEDPHFLQARPSCILQARDADLWIRVGLDLEIGWEPPILEGSRNGRISVGAKGHLDASECASVLEVPVTTITRAMGDVHPLGNPHYWLDPLNGRRIAGAIAERLAEIAPAHAADWRRNAASFQRALDERMFGPVLVKALGGDALWAKMESGTLAAFLKEEANRSKEGGWVAAMLPLRGGKILTYHQSWVYFAHRFGLAVVDELEPKPGIPPTATHLAEVSENARAEGVKLILQEPFYSTKAAARVAGKIGARVVVVASSVGGQPEATDYLALMDLIVRLVSGAQP